MTRPVLVYRETLLAASEPFVASQGEGLDRHVAHYLSLRRASGHQVPAGRDLRWRHVPLVDPARRWAWKRWGVSRGTARAVRRIGPVLVHAHFGRDAVQVLPLVRRLGVPLVVTFHGQDALRSDESFRTGSRSDRLYLDRRADLAATASRLLAVSDFVRARLLASGFPAERVERHYIGVDVDEIARHAGPPERGLVVFAGRLVPHKGAADLIAAVGRDARLVVIGDGPERAALRRLAGARGVNATFLGFQPPPVVWRWMGAASAVVVPSRTAADGWQEGFGLVAAEAQAAGTPVIASTCGGLPEAVAPACADLLFPEGDVDALAGRLRAVLDGDRDGAAAQAWVREHRNLAVQNRRLDDIYDEVAS